MLIVQIAILEFRTDVGVVLGEFERNLAFNSAFLRF